MARGWPGQWGSMACSDGGEWRANGNQRAIRLEKYARAGAANRLADCGVICGIMAWRTSGVWRMASWCRPRREAPRNALSGAAARKQ